MNKLVTAVILMIILSIIPVPQNYSMISSDGEASHQMGTVSAYEFSPTTNSISPSINSQIEISSVIDPPEEDISADAVSLTSPDDVGLILNTPIYEIVWTVSGSGNLANLKYDIFLDGVEVATGNVGPDNEISYLFNPDTLGEFNVTLNVIDGGVVAADTVIVSVIDNLRIIKQPKNETFSFGSDQNFLEWIVADNDPKSYTIFRNGTEIVTSGWLSGEPIRYNMAGTSLGIYNITILLTDYSGNSISDFVLIEITAGPVLVGFTETTVFDNESLTQEYYWQFDDSDPESYVIYNATHQLESGTWESNQLLNVTFDTTQHGMYDFNIYVNDTGGQFIWSNVTLTVTDRPEILLEPIPPEPDEIFIFDELQPFTFEWEAEDMFPSTYVIKINGSQVNSSTWSNGEIISFDMSNYSRGIYNVSMTFYDIQGLSRTDFVLVEILDSTDPQVSAISDQEVSYTASNVILDFDAQDRNPDVYEIYIDSELVEQSFWQDIISYTYSFNHENIGSHNITGVFYDDSGNFGFASLTVSIIDDQVPVLLEKSSDTSFEVDSEGQVFWTFYDAQPNQYSIRSNLSNQIVKTSNWATNVSIDFTIPTNQTYSVEYIITVTDLSLNSLNASIILRIVPISTNQPELLGFDQTYASDPLPYRGNWTIPDGSGISGATITGMLSDTSSQNLSSFDELTDQDGEYSITLDHDRVSPGIYQWEITFSKFQHINWTLVLEVEVAWHTVEFSIQIPSEIRQGEAFTMIIEVAYDDELRGISVFRFEDRNGPAEGLGFEFNYTLSYLNGRHKQSVDSYITDVNGQVSILVPGSETEGLERISGFSLKFNEDLELILKTDLTELNIDPRIRGSNLINSFILVFGFNPLILVIIVLLVFIRPLTDYFKNLYYYLLQLFGKWKYQNLYELSLTQTFLVFNNNGILFYSKQFDPERGTDPSLVAGLSSAITAFMSELDNKGRSGFHLMDRKDLSILIHSLEGSSIALLSNQEVGDELREMIESIHDDISATFKGHFEKGIGDFTSRDDEKVNRILEKHEFPVDLMSSVIFDYHQVIQTIQDPKFPRIWKGQIQIVMNNLSTDYDETSQNFYKLVRIFSSNGLPPQIAAKCVYELYLHDGFY